MSAYYKMNVLSLFDGISCARVALDRAGIEVNAYMASEIDKNAIKVSDKNYPDIIRVGSVVNLEVEGQVDLLIGGSPCQDLSIAKKDRKGLEGNRSGLFWEFVRIKKECNPQWFVLENVASMPKADRDIITKEMGVEPVMFNASLVSAQCRKRLFWTNIPFDLPEDRGILLKDILQPDGEVDERMVMKGKAYTLTASYSKATPSPAQVEHNIKKGQRTMVRVGHIGNSDAQANRVYDTDGKSATLSANGGGLGAKTGLYKVGRDIGRRLIDGHRADADTSIPYERRIETREDDKCGTLTSVAKDNLVVGDRIRKLTPIECERLQGLPDNYTEGVATTNRYKCLGNAFNVDVVAHILSRVKLMYA
jgi:DNA-cytosine methyltransferase